MQIIYLSDDDTVDAIAGKIKNSPEKEINLVILSRAIAVLSVVNLKMFKKIAESLNKSISVSTADEAVKILAENADVKINSMEKGVARVEAKTNYPINNFAGKVKSVDSIGWNRSASVSPSRYQSSPDRFHGPLTPEEGINEEIAKFQVSKTSRNIFLGFLAMAMIAAAVAGYILLPTAKIIITPKANPINTNFEFIIDKNIKTLDAAAKKVPATVIVADIEKDGQFTATGKKQLTSNATGTVTIYNEWSSFPQKLAENTRLSTSDGKIYKITRSVTVPGFMRDESGSDVPGRIEVPIVASGPGPEYNIDPADFTIPGFKGAAKYVKIYAKSSTAASGGALGYTTVASADDFKKAKDFLEEEAKKNIVSQLSDKKPSDLIMIDQAISVKSGNLVPSVGLDQAASKFKASLKISAMAFLFNPNDVKSIAASILKEINEEKKNFVIIDAGLDYGEVLVVGSDTIKLSVQSHANAFNLINENDMRAKIAGKSKEELENYIKNNYPDISKINVTLWPFWVKKIPIIEKNVSISLDIPHGK